MAALKHRLRAVIAMARLAWVFGDDERRLAEEIVEYAEQQGYELHTHCGAVLPSETWSDEEVRAIQELHDAAGHKTFYASNCWEEPCQELV